jgi:hypothetical protein
MNYSIDFLDQIEIGENCKNMEQKELMELLPQELLSVSHSSPPVISSLAWYKNDAKKVVAILYEKKKIIIGGEVLVQKGNELDETWDYWNFNIEEGISHQENVEKSNKEANDSIDYLSKILGDGVLFTIHIRTA